MLENQALWRSRRSTATVKSKSEVKRLILKHFEVKVDFLMHISGLKSPRSEQENLLVNTTYSKSIRKNPPENALRRSLQEGLCHIQ